MSAAEGGGGWKMLALADKGKSGVRHVLTVAY